MATARPSLAARHPWLIVVSVIALIGFCIYTFKKVAEFRALSNNKSITVDQVGPTMPIGGSYSITGGLLNYVYAQAVGFANDKDKDAGSNYDSYVPYIDPKTKRVVMLVKMPGYSPSELLVHSDDPPEAIQGTFQDPATVEPEIYADFVNRHYGVPQGIPLFEMFGGNPASLSSQITVAAILAVLFGGTPWLIMYFVTRPKKRRKRFSERYPERRIY